MDRTNKKMRIPIKENYSTYHKTMTMDKVIITFSRNWENLSYLERWKVLITIGRLCNNMTHRSISNKISVGKVSNHRLQCRFCTLQYLQFMTFSLILMIQIYNFLKGKGKKRTASNHYLAQSSFRLVNFLREVPGWLSTRRPICSTVKEKIKPPVKGSLERSSKIKRKLSK